MRESKLRVLNLYRSIVMEDSAIKSPNPSIEGQDEENNPNRITSQANTSIILVDKYKFVGNPVPDCQNKYKTDDKEAIVEESENPEMIVPCENLQPVIRSKKIMTKSARNETASKKTRTITPVITRGRQILAEKQSPYSGDAFLRSGRRRATDSSTKSMNAKILDKNKGLTDKNKTEISENCEQSTGEKSCSAGGNSNAEIKETEPESLRGEKGDEKMETKETVSYDGLSLIDKMLLRSNEIVGNLARNSNVQKNAEESLTKESNESEQNVTEPEKKFHRRKSSEPFKNERVQTRQSKSINLMQIKNDLEIKYFGPRPKAGKCTPSQAGEQLDEKSSIVCTPDINMNDRSESTNFAENNRPDSVAELDEENNRGERTSEDNHTALNLTNQRNDTKCKTPPDRRSAVQRGPIVRRRKTNCCSEREQKAPQISKLLTQESAARNTKRNVRHLNAQAMPVYVSKGNIRKSPGLDSGINASEGLESGRNEAEGKEEHPVTPETESDTFFNSLSPPGKPNRSTEPKLSHLQDGNTDSEGTLSNVESVPNSPAQESRKNVAAKKLKLGDKCVNLNSGKNKTRKKNLNSLLHRIPTIKNVNTELQAASTSKQLDKGISSNNKEKSTLRYYVETSEKRNPNANSENTTEDDANNDDGLQDTPWLRHYERPQGTNKNTAKIRTGVGNNKKENPSLNTGNAASDNVPAALRKQKRQFTELTRKRGRPRKQDTETSETNPKKKQRPSSNETNGPPANTASSGSGLTLRELEQLFFKYIQDGHFRVDPRQRPIVIYSNDLHHNFTSKIQGFDPRKYFMHPRNTETTNNSETNTVLRPDHDWNRFCPSDSTSEHFEHRMRTMTPNSQNLSNQSIEQIPYSRNYKPCSTRTNSGQCGANSNNFKDIVQMNSVSSCMQSGYGTASSYQQNCYHNNGNIMGNNSYFNSYSGMVTAIDSMNNTSTSTNNELNYSPHAQQLHENSMPYKEMDLSMHNGTSASTNSTQNSSTNNVTSNDWNDVSSALDSVSGLLMDLNSMNHVNADQAAGGNLDSNNITNDQNSMNGPNPWMNRANNMTNPRYQMMQPWSGTFPMYNSYWNNDGQYYNGMLNPYSYMRFEYSNNINARIGMETNNGNPWAQNYHPNIGGGHSNFNDTNPQFSGINSCYLQENSVNQGMNLSLSSDPVNDPQGNTMELDDTNLSIAQDSGLNSSVDQMEKIVPEVASGNDESVQQSTRGYAEQMGLPYSLLYQKDTENLGFDEVDMVAVDGQQEENQPQMQDYTNQSLPSFERCFQRYSTNGTSSCEIAAELTNNVETAISKLRQELVDFTKQYSEGQTSPPSQILQEDEIFDCMMRQHLDTDESSTS